MANTPVIEKVEAFLNELISETPELFLVEIKVKPTNNIKVFLDGDNGVTIKQCVQLNRKLYAKIEEEAYFPEGDFSLEVSSAGIGEPLLKHRQFIKNINRYLEVKLIDNSTVVEGKLINVSDNDFQLEVVTGKGKKQTTTQPVFEFSAIKSASVEVKF